MRQTGYRITTTDSGFAIQTLNGKTLVEEDGSHGQLAKLYAETERTVNQLRPSRSHHARGGGSK